MPTYSEWIADPQKCVADMMQEIEARRRELNRDVVPEIITDHDTGQVYARVPEMEHWYKVYRFVDGQIKETCCCCNLAGATSRECMIAKGCKTPCRCDCHRTTKRRK